LEDEEAEAEDDGEYLGNLLQRIAYEESSDGSDANLTCDGGEELPGKLER